MPVEITGLVSHNKGTPLHHAPQDEFDPVALLNSAKAQEAAGYDRVLIANNSLTPDSHTIAAHVLAGTDKLKVLLAHRPGFIAPTMAARMLTTIDRLAPGRMAVHIIAGPNDKELEADGDFTAKPDRYARADEYVGIMRRIWSTTEPIDHQGRFYRFSQAFSPVKPGRITVSWAGTSPESIAACGRHADLFAMSGDTLANIADHRDKVVQAAHGRPIDFMMTVLVILGDTEAQAWEKAEGVLNDFRAMMARQSATQGPSNFAQPTHSGNAILASAQSAHRHDRCLWLGITELAQGRFGNQAALVGTPDQVCAALMDYYAMGVTRFLIRGFRPDQDVPEYGEKLFPRLRAAALDHDLLFQGVPAR